mmetsp:Transcript_25789/g.58391  ORF Transcript_25789/g.58391 Transcript_25789/m.58391 type:complete len:236 (-) Transcript_25789:600-1307(-)
MGCGHQDGATAAPPELAASRGTKDILAHEVLDLSRQGNAPGQVLLPSYDIRSVILVHPLLYCGHHSISQHIFSLCDLAFRSIAVCRQALGVQKSALSLCGRAMCGPDINNMALYGHAINGHTLYDLAVCRPALHSPAISIDLILCGCDLYGPDIKSKALYGHVINGHTLYDLAVRRHALNSRAICAHTLCGLVGCGLALQVRMIPARPSKLIAHDATTTGPTIRRHTLYEDPVVP